MTNHEIVRGLMDGFLFWKLTFDRCSFHKVGEVVKAIGEYNEFEPEQVSALLHTITIYPSNVASQIIMVTVGREYSPVVYVEVKQELAEALMKIFRDLKNPPQELSIEKDESPSEYAKVRAWWD